MWIKLIEALLPLLVGVILSWLAERQKRKRKTKLDRVGEALMSEDPVEIAVFLEELGV